jgi:hypothetical protein
MNARPLDQNEKDCVLLARAVADGRYAEDPGHWAPHLASCEDCRRCAEGFVLLRGSIERARGPETEGATPMPEAGKTVAVALHRFRTRQRKRRVLVGVGAALVLGAGSWVAFKPRAEPSPFSADVLAAVAEEDFAEPLATVMRLRWSIAPRMGGVGYAKVLKTNAPLRAEFERALNHPSADVRRTALSGLTMGGIEIDQGKLMEVLRTWNEDVGTGRRLAAAGGPSENNLTADLERSWAQTLVVGLDAARLAAASGKHLPVESIELHLQHPDPRVVQAALQVLEANPAYVPGEAVAKLFEDPKLPRDLRLAAGRCWMERLGPAGTARLIRSLEASSDDPVFESVMSYHLLRDAEALPWLRARALSAETPLSVALRHAEGLWKLGEAIDLEPLVLRGLASEDIQVLMETAGLCWKADLRAHRKRFQERFLAERASWTEWREASSGRFIRLYLLNWDEATGLDQHLAWGLALCDDESLRDARVRAILERISALPDGEPSREAKRLLARELR